MPPLRVAILSLVLLVSLASRLGSGTSAPFDPTTATATYRVTFVATWSSATHPSGFPAGGHFSPLVGATHDKSIRFWRNGGYANQGIESMAETGNPFPLIELVEERIAQGLADRYLLGAGIGSPGATSIEFTATRDFSRLTLVSMVAPSPDWFVGVSRFRLLRKGEWIDSDDVELRVWDAGSDSGATFQAANSESHATIRPLVNSYFPAASKPVGRFVIERIG
jgi:hypothetical protein